MAGLNGWTWGRRGVELHDRHLLWYEDLGPVAFASGAACEQAFDDFLARGPHTDGVPADVLAEVAAAVCDRTAADPAAVTRLAEALDARGTPAAIDTTATALLRRAADAGFPRAQGLLGKRYLNGTGGVAADPDAARRLFERGAEGGDARSQNNLAVLLMPADPAAAERLFRRAAESGDSVAAFNLGNVLWEAALQSRGDLSDPLQWFLRSADAGYDKAQARLGQELVLGNGCAKDSAAARHWFLQAARQGHAVAQLNVGVMYEKGEGGPASFDDAELWFRRAAEAGNATASRYRTDLLGEQAAPTRAAPPGVRRTPAVGGRPQWEWEGNYRVFRLGMPDADTVELSVVEDDGLTNGHAGMTAFERAVPLGAFLADGPPMELVDFVELATLVRVTEALCGDRGVAEPDWLSRLRFHDAARTGSPDVVRDRFARASPATVRDPVGGRDALYWAVAAGRVETVRLLVGDLGCDPNRVYPNRTGPSRTLLMWAVRATWDWALLNVLGALYVGGADLELRNDRDETALHWLLGSGLADGAGSVPAFEWLLKRGADPNALRSAPAAATKRSKKAAVGPPPRTPLVALAQSNYLPEHKVRLARSLFAAGATVAAVPEPLRGEFRAALQTWGPDSWTLGKSLGTRAAERYWLDSHPLFFRDAVAGFEVELCQVANSSMGFLPHAPDEHWSFEAVLYAVGTTLIARVSKFHDVLDERDVTDLWFESATDGRMWSACRAAPDVTGTVELSRCTD